MCSAKYNQNWSNYATVGISGRYFDVKNVFKIMAWLYNAAAILRHRSSATIRRVLKHALPMCGNFQISAWEIKNARLTWLTTIRTIFESLHFHTLFVVGFK